MHVTETMIRPNGGCRIFVRHCHAASGPRSRTLILLHGACEHGERYLGFARWMTQRRWNVIIPDLRGHGRSDGVRTHIRDFSEYVTDVEAVRRHFRLAPDDTALFGHSTGGLISVLYAIATPGQLSAVALSSPLLALKVAIPRTTISLGRVVSLVAPQTRFRSRVSPSDTTRNVQARDLRLHDPLTQRSVTAGWYFAMRRALRRAWSDAESFDSPLLIVQAGQDRIVDPDAPRKWIERTNSSDAQFCLRRDDFHELLNEPTWEETAAILAEWLGQRLSSPRAIARTITA